MLNQRMEHRTPDRNSTDSMALSALDILAHPRLLGVAFILLALSACKTMPVAGPLAAQVVVVDDPGRWQVIDYARAPSVDEVVTQILDRRAIFVGESHDLFSHHLGQLEIIKGLYERGVPLVIGLEMVQQPFQSVLDAYVAGRLDDTELLRGIEWYKRWKFDFRLYRPIFHFAREHGIPLRALNVPVEVTQAISKVGLAGLPEALRRQLPAEMDLDVRGYAERLEKVFQKHPGSGKRNMAHFIEVQLAWDEGMAAAAADYLRAHTQKTMVMLAGAGHIVEGTGIPQRLQRRVDVPMATILQLDSGMDLSRRPADYVILSPIVELPPAGLIGVVLEQVENGMKIASISPDSHARDAGIQEGDVLVEANGVPIRELADLRLQMWVLKPGDRLSLVVLRGDGASARRIPITVTLK